MSRNKHNSVPQIRYDFNRITDRRREQRLEKGTEIYFRDTSAVSSKIEALFSGKLRDRN